jgi:cytochrome c oxidase subunit I
MPAVAACRTTRCRDVCRQVARAVELGRPGLQFLSAEQYNQLFTIHGTVMLLLFATPVVFAFANYVVPLQIGAPDVAFPRLNALAYWF